MNDNLYTALGEEEERLNKNYVAVNFNLRELQHISKVLDRELKEVKRINHLHFMLKDGEHCAFIDKEVERREMLLNKVYKVIDDLFEDLYEGK